MKKKTLFAITLIAAIFTSCDKDDDYDYEKPGNPQVEVNEIKASGDAPAINTAIDQFRQILGDPLNATPNQASGRREVNWDGAPANLTNNNNFPPDFFNLTDPAGANGRKRGLIYLPSGGPL